MGMSRCCLGALQLRLLPTSQLSPGFGFGRRVHVHGREEVRVKEISQASKPRLLFGSHDEPALASYAAAHISR